LLDLVNALTLVEGAFGLEEKFGEGASAELVDEPKVIFVFTLSLEFAKRVKARVVFISIEWLIIWHVKGTMPFYIILGAFEVAFVLFVFRKLLDSQFSICGKVPTKPNNSASTFAQQPKLFETGRTSVQWAILFNLIFIHLVLNPLSNIV